MKSSHLGSKNIIYYITPVSIFILFLVLLTISCQKTWDEPFEPPVNIDQETVVASIRGIIVNENNIPVESATVKAGNVSTTTDRYGEFRIDNVTLSKNNGFVKVMKEGYFNGNRSFVSVAGRIHNVRIKLLPKNNSGSFSASSGGTVNLNGGAKLTVPASAITDISGNAYPGLVNVAMTWIDPTSTDLPYTLQGDLRGITSGGEETGLQTFGMIGVELTGSGGQKLKIASGKTAELTFPVPVSLSGNAPAAIDLWHFDEDSGRWKQEGEAVKSGNNYVAYVSHFSFWNCDATFPVVDLCMKIIESASSLPLNNATVRIKRTTTGSYGYGTTDSIGNLCGKVPQNEPLQLEILDQCGIVAVSQNIGPFSSDADLGNVAVAVLPTNMLTITGVVTDCNNVAVPNGVVEIYTGTGYSYSGSVVNGNFSVTILNCGNPVNYSVLPVNYTALQQGGPITGTAASGIINVGVLQACGTSIQEFVELLIDAVPVNFVSPPDQIGMVDSSQTGTSGVITNQFGVFAFSNTNTVNYINVAFQNIPTVGVSSLASISLSLSAGIVFPNSPTGSQQIVSANPVVNITSLGPPVTGFIEGNFNIQMNFSGTIKTVNCNFKVKRD